MNKLQANRIPLLALIIIVMSVMGLILMATTRHARAATTIHVTTTANSGAGSLRQAISDAVAGDTIDFQLSYPATITLTSGELLINRNLTINGPGANQLTVSGNNASRVFHLTSPATVTISGLTITKGNSTDGGGILSEQAPFTLQNCVIANNMAVSGGGILNLNESAWMMTNCTISDNTATGEGGGIHNKLGTLTMTNCTVSNNTTGGGNGGTGGIANGSGQLTLTNCTVVNNSAVSSNGTKGGIKASGQVTLNNTIVAGNTKNSGSESSDIEGGTVAAASHCLIGNAGTSGGITNGANGNIVGVNGSGTRPIDTIINPVLAENGGPAKTHMIVCGSVAYNTGDNALAASLTKDQRGSTRVIDGTIDIGALEVHPVNNTNDSGPGSLRQVIDDAASGDCLDIDSCLTGTITVTSGQFFIQKNLTINGPGADKVTLSGNNASAIFHFFQVSNAAINRLTLANANGPSSAINDDQSNLTLNDCTVSHNTGVGFGGILITEASLTLNNCTVSHNTSNNNGGGILTFPLPGGTGSQITINSCTISDNAATTSGGGIYNDSGSITINNSTIANNSAANGGGIYSKSGTLTLNNSTISNNSASSLGGGIYNSTNAELTVTNSTITGNRSGLSSVSQGGGMFLSGTETLNNSIIAGNFQGLGTTPDDLVGTADNASHNLIGDANTSGGIQNGTNGNLVGVNVATVLNPMLADNGGPTPTIALLCGSPAIDAGDNTLASTLATDQRGLLRIYDGNGDATATVDIGAFEQQNTCPTITAQTVSLAKNSSLTGVQIATVKDAEDAETSLAVTINSPLNNVTISNLSVAADGKVTANVTAPCNATSASFTLSVKDSAMQTVQATLTVTVTASNAPSFTSCPGNITRSNDPGQCTASVSFAPTASDDCAGSIVPVCKVGDTTITSPYPFLKGITTVTCTATDADNQTATCSFTVTVNDTTAPTINCPANITKSTDPNQCAALVSFAPTATDNCSGVGTPTCTPPSGSSFPKGTTTVTCTVKDAANNQSAPCSFTVTVVDTQAPTITCPANIITNTVNAGDASVAVTFAAPTAADNCSGVSVACVPPSGSMFPRGVTTVNCTATDASNNQANCSFTVRVFDYVIVDDSNGKIMRFDSVTGDYDFFDCRKNKSLSGRGTVTINACKTELRDSKPDRTVTVLANPCTRSGNTTVINGGATHTLNDLNLSNNRVSCP